MLKNACFSFFFFLTFTNAKLQQRKKGEKFDLNTPEKEVRRF